MSHLTLRNARELHKQWRQFDSCHPPSKMCGPGNVSITEKLLLDAVGYPVRTTVRELPKVECIPEGTLDAVLVTHVESPQEFYLVMKGNAKYSLNHPEWTRFFPPFKNGFEALHGLTMMLSMYCKLSLKRGYNSGKKEPFRTGDLVAVTLSQPKVETRRGLVVATMEDIKGSGKAPPIHQVYLFDFGIHITVPGSCLLELPKPFNCIGPLAIRATLFGVSPVAERWDSPSINFFKETLKSHETKTSITSIEVMSRVAKDVPSDGYPILVNLEAQKLIRNPKNPSKSTREFQMNFADELIKEGCGLPWNLFPARPKLMKGNEVPATLAARDHFNGRTRFPVSLRTGILLTQYHPVYYSSLSQEVLKREVTKMFRLRKFHVIDVLRMEYRLWRLIEEGNPTLLQAYQTPCKIVK